MALRPTLRVLPKSFTCLPVRTFTSTTPAQSTKDHLAHLHKTVPPYPYGYERFYKQSNLGLYGGLKIRTGHNVSEKSETKTRRKWRPNIQRKKLWSVSLNRFVRLKVATRVLRTIDKVGGLDEYLLGDKAARIKELGMHGWLLRWRIMQTGVVKQRFREEYARQLALLGLNGEEAGAVPTTTTADDTLLPLWMRKRKSELRSMGKSEEESTNALIEQIDDQIEKESWELELDMAFDEDHRLSDKEPAVLTR